MGRLTDATSIMDTSSDNLLLITNPTISLTLLSLLNRMDDSFIRTTCHSYIRNADVTHIGASISSQQIKHRQLCTASLKRCKKGDLSDAVVEAIEDWLKTHERLKLREPRLMVFREVKCTNVRVRRLSAVNGKQMRQPHPCRCALTVSAFLSNQKQTENALSGSDKLECITMIRAIVMNVCMLQDGICLV